MKIAITGSEGNLGKWLVNVYGFTPLGCDITNAEAVKEAINTISPDIIIHNAALTNVDQCEHSFNDAYKVNVAGTSHILDYFTKGTLIYLSTVHVFDGKSKTPYSEKSKACPINNYGWTKWSGELMCATASCQTIIVRISKLFDLDWCKLELSYLKTGLIRLPPNFIYRSFIYIPHFVDGLLSLIQLRETAPKVINIAGTGKFSYYEFWKGVAYYLGYSTNSITSRSDEIPNCIPVPYNGRLSVELANSMGIPLYSTLDGVEEMKKLL